MYIFERGKGDAVVLLHGANPVSYFDELVAALAPRHRVLVPHLPGWGESPPLSNGQGFEVTNAALSEALRQAGVSRLAIVGYSLGDYDNGSASGSAYIRWIAPRAVMPLLHAGWRR